MSLNAFRLTGDSFRAIATLIYLYVIAIKQNGAGISLRSQELMLLVCLFRYLDMFTTFYSWYNTFMKVFYPTILITSIVFLRCIEPTCSTYNRRLDQGSFSSRALILFALLLGFAIHIVGSGQTGDYFDPVEWGWTVSMILEPLSVLPQLAMFRRNRITSITIRTAMALMMMYRFLYILNWVHRAHFEIWYRHHPLAYTAAVVQTLFHYDFVAYHICGDRTQDDAASSGLTEWLLSSAQEDNADERDDGEGIVSADDVEEQQVVELSGPLDEELNQSAAQTGEEEPLDPIQEQQAAAVENEEATTRETGPTFSLFGFFRSA